MESKPQASIVIPCYNGQAYIAETLKSCLNQTRSRYEIIVVDDCSKDNSVRIIKRIMETDKRIRLIQLEKNGERSNARNIAIENSKADIILMLDSDDIMIDNRVEVMIKEFNKRPEIDIIYTNYHLIDENSNPIGLVDCEQISIDKIKKTLYNGIGHSTMAFRKRVFDTVKYPGGEWDKLGIDDWKFQWDAYTGGYKFLLIKQPLSLYRFIPKVRDENRVAFLKHKEIKAFEDKVK